MNMELTESAFTRPNDLACINDISGPSAEGRPKAHISIDFHYLYSDGTFRQIPGCDFIKPILTIWTDGVYAHIDMDFGSRTDYDLNAAWEALRNFSRPDNSVRYTNEQVDSGFYDTSDGPKMVFQPIINLYLSPIGKEDSYMIHAHKPLTWCLTPADPKGDACVIRMSFEDAAFFVVNGLEPLDHEAIVNEIMADYDLEFSQHPQQGQ